MAAQRNSFQAFGFFELKLKLFQVLRFHQYIWYLLCSGFVIVLSMLEIEFQISLCESPRPEWPLKHSRRLAPVLFQTN